MVGARHMSTVRYRGALGDRRFACHLLGMGASYVFLLIAFYVDNGKNLPVWRDLPPATYWLIPSAIGIPLMLFVLLRHPLTRRARSSDEREKRI
jgi:hypothetical protein